MDSKTMLEAPKHAHWIIYLVMLALSILGVIWWQAKNNMTQREDTERKRAIVALNRHATTLGEVPRATSLSAPRHFAINDEQKTV